MKRVIAILFLVMIAGPVSAQWGSAIGSVIGRPTSRNNITVVNQQPTCNPPQNLVGRSIGQIEGMRFNQPVRILRPNEMITSDYDARRINIGLDMNGIIREVHCG